MRTENISFTFTVGFSKEVTSAVKFYSMRDNLNFDSAIKGMGYWAIGLLNDGAVIQEGVNVFSLYEDPFYIWYDLKNRLIRISFNEPHGPKGKIERDTEKLTRTTAVQPGQGIKNSRRRRGKGRRK